MKKTQILVVEDEGIIAKDLQSMLRKLGYEVPVTVGTGEKAISTAGTNRPDLVLMDINLRGAMDGVEAAAAISATHDIPVVYLTANSDEATLQRAKVTDPFGFLIKPFEERALHAGIEMALYKHRSEKQSREREQWLSTTLTSIADAVITTNRDGRVTFLNAAAERLAGWERADVVGRPYPEVFPLIDELTGEVPPDRVAAALSNGISGNFGTQTLLVRRDGSTSQIEHSVAPIREGSDGEIEGCVIVFSDVSNRRQLEDQLRQVQKMDAIGKLAGGIAHDFNNAITAIMGYAEMILLHAKETDQLYSDAKQIVRAAEHSARLTHQLLAFSRKQVLQPRCLHLGSELSDMEGMVRRLIGANIQLVTHVEPDLWHTTADAGQMQQVVLNMAVNARDAMPQGGRLRIALSNATVSADEAVRIPDGFPGEFVQLTISDTGSGMSREVMRRIFEPFFTTKDPGKGTGLGLATCYGIIRQTSGMVSVASEPGVGTTFSIYLPKAVASKPAAVHIFGDDELPGGNETILVVEDEEILRELAIQVLQGLGYRVLTAEDGANALEILHDRVADDIQLIVTDLVMPRMGGRELAAWIARDFGRMRVVFMSGYTDDEIVRHAVADAEVEYLQKPFSPKTLAHKIREVLDRPAPSQSAAA
jgi:PAS domain S-box-containing protein